MKKYVPSALTLLNLTCGFVAILLNDMLWSPVIIAIGALLDVFDGLTAKLLNAISELGKQLDSLADLITFGVAPAYLYYHHILPQSTLGIIIASLLPAFGALRLARFNIDNEQNLNFKGLPIPANGIFFLSIPFLLNFNNDNWFHQIIENEYVIYLLPFLFSLLMVSSVKMFSFKSINGLVSIQVLLIIIGIIFIILFRWIAIPLTVLAYILFSIVTTLQHSKS